MDGRPNKNGLLDSLPDAESIRERLSQIAQERHALERLLGVINRRDKITPRKCEGVAQCG